MYGVNIREHSYSLKKRFGSFCKELCIRCHNENEDEWNAYDEYEWDMGIFHCPSEYFNDNEVPSSNCPYGLEHMMKMQRELVEE